jgi:heat shock protein HslJ
MPIAGCAQQTYTADYIIRQGEVMVTVKLMFASIALVLVAGCTRAATLANTSWNLTSFGSPGVETPILAGSRINLQFNSADEVSGSAGCNMYRGKYQIQDSAVTFLDVGSTLIGCYARGVMLQENRYLAALRTTGTFELVGDSLTISYDGGKGVLRFTRGVPGK